ncbi:unnamed protein product [Dovyalis caffra]|uniref:Uncharacterized protein n=1 Tax=Dovyalis caffra TaxID=77055 RepID=A0AAV1RKZ3_9ROSI|nr:unnamed protein product [Dovyalis caffra]
MALYTSIRCKKAGEIRKRELTGCALQTAATAMVVLFHHGDEGRKSELICRTILFLGKHDAPAAESNKSSFPHATSLPTP